VERLVDLSLRRPAAVLAAAVLLAALAAAGASRLRTEVGYRAFLGASHPAVRTLDAFLERFGGGLPMAAVFACGESPCESALGPEALRMSYAVARAMEEVAGVARVDAPATSPLLVRDLGLPETRRLAPGGVPAPDRARLAERARHDPLWRGQLVSPDGRAGAILVHLASTEAARGEAAVRALREALAPWEARGFRFHLVGGPVEFVVAGGELARVTARLVPAMVAVVAVALALAFRSLAAAGAVLGCVGLAVLGTVGLQGALGWPRNTLTEVLPPLVLVMGVCDAVHLLAAHAAMTARGLAPAEAMRAAARRVARPCVLTTLTTAAGFASFATSELGSFARFGALAASGVVLALVVSFGVLPPLAVRLPVARAGAEVAGRRVGRALARGGNLARRRAGTVVALAAVAAALGAAGFATLRVEARFEDLYGEESQVVRWARAAAVHLREAETLEVALVPPEPRLPPAAATLRAVARLEEELAALPGLAPGVSVLTPLRAVHGLLHGAPLPLDDDGARAASAFRLVRAEEPDLLRRLADPRSGAVRLSLQAEKLPQHALRALVAEAEARARAARPPGHEVVVTGAVVVVGRMIDAIRRTQLESFAAAALLVALLVAAFLRSPAAALLATLPTALAVGVTLGAMGALGIPLDVGSAMVAAAVLGLAVDDAVHLLVAWRVHRERGESPAAAMQSALQDVGRALVATSAALAAGFAVLAAMPWRSVASFGRVAAVAIGVALLANLLLLPALVALSERVRGRRTPGTRRAPRRRP
jgi:predicted RND superfamily exporter protein